MELQERKWKAEMELREREMESGERKWKAEMELRAQELDLKKATAEREQNAKKSMASRLKLWGDGLRN